VVIGEIVCDGGEVIVVDIKLLPGVKSTPTVNENGTAVRHVPLARVRHPIFREVSAVIFRGPTPSSRTFAFRP
jgi:hypothetical protein